MAASVGLVETLSARTDRLVDEGTAAMSSTRGGSGGPARGRAAAMAVNAR